MYTYVYIYIYIYVTMYISISVHILTISQPCFCIVSKDQESSET